MSKLEKFKDFIKSLGPNFHMCVVWFFTNVFWIVVVIILIMNLKPRSVDISQQQDLPNQSQTQQYKFGK